MREHENHRGRVILYSAIPSEQFKRGVGRVKGHSSSRETDSVPVGASSPNWATESAEVGTEVPVAKAHPADLILGPFDAIDPSGQCESSAAHTGRLAPGREEVSLHGSDNLRRAGQIALQNENKTRVRCGRAR